MLEVALWQEVLGSGPDGTKACRAAGDGAAVEAANDMV